MGLGGIASYLFNAFLHKAFVIGLFRCVRGPSAEQVMAEISPDMEPVSLTLNDYRITLDNGQWSSDLRDDCSVPRTHDYGALERLRTEKSKLTKELEKYKRESREVDKLQERWTNLDFKYQLLMDMWALRTLDQERSPSGRQSPTGDRTPSAVSISSNKSKK